MRVNRKYFTPKAQNTFYGPSSYTHIVSMYTCTPVSVVYNWYSVCGYNIKFM